MSLWSNLRRHLPFRSTDTTEAQLERLQKLIGYRFNDPDLLCLGLTHRSVSRAANSHQPSNERLEFLGDSVLGLVIADQLYRDYPCLTEGDLTKKKAMLVNETTLSNVAVEIGLNDFVFMSPEEERSGGRERPSIISDAFESVIGAVYIDGGLEAARQVVLLCIYSRRESILSDISQRNFKGELLEHSQARGQGMPSYDILSETGPDHNKTFHVVVSISGVMIGEGTGSSKKEAEQAAACLALERLAEQAES